MKSVTVASFNSHADAGPLLQHLAQFGIAAELATDSRVEQDLTYSRPGAGVQVRVSRADFQRALEIVSGWNGGSNGQGRSDAGLGHGSHSTEDHGRL